MLDALVAGTTGPRGAGGLGEGQAAHQDPRRRAGPEGRFEDHHSLVIGAILAQLDFLDEHIDRVSEAIQQLGPSGLAGVALASTITGVATSTAAVMVAEIGTRRPARSPACATSTADVHGRGDRDAPASTITGVATSTADVMVAEIGTDIARVRDGRALAKLGSALPRQRPARRQRRSGRNIKGPKWLGIALEEAALGARTSGHGY